MFTLCHWHIYSWVSSSRYTEVKSLSFRVSFEIFHFLLAVISVDFVLLITVSVSFSWIIQFCGLICWNNSHSEWLDWGIDLVGIPQRGKSRTVTCEFSKLNKLSNLSQLINKLTWFKIAQSLVLFIYKWGFKSQGSLGGHNDTRSYQVCRFWFSMLY